MSRQIPNHTVESIQEIVDANPSLKKLWKPRLKIFKSKNFSLDPFKLEAFSYGWWQFVTKKGNRVFFNEYRYSATTAKHQNKAMQILQILGIETHEVNTPISLNSDLDDKLSFYEAAWLTVKARKSKYKQAYENKASRLIDNTIALGGSISTYYDCMESAEKANEQRLERNREKARVRRQAKHVEIFNADAKSIVLN